MAGVICAAAIVIVLFPVTRATRNHASQSRTVKKTAVGVLYSLGGGSHIQSAQLKTASGMVSFAITDGTRTNFKQFPNRQYAFDNYWNLGAEWRVVYEVPKDPNDEFGSYADSVIFTGRVEPAIAKANQLAHEYLDLLSNRNYTQAYSKLSSAAKQRMGYADFERVYRSVDVSMRSLVICSHDTDRVVIFLAPQGEGGEIFQRCEIIRTGNSWYIDRLGKEFEQSGHCA